MTPYIKSAKILFIGQLPPPVHGASLMNDMVVRSTLLRKNYSMEVINLQFASSVNELKKFRIGKVFKAISFSWQILRKCITQNPDLVYFNLSPNGFAFIRDVWFVLLLKILNRKIIYHLHSKGIKANAEKSKILKHLYIFVFKNCDLICISKRLEFDFRDVFRSEPIIVPNGIDLINKFQRSSHRSENSLPQILYLSNFITSKGVLVLIEALSILQTRGILFKARLVGAPADLSIEFLESVISDKKLKDSVQITGPAYGNAKNKEFENADIFVFPTYDDIFGLVNLEAMQHCLPVISTYEGAIPDVVIDGETGYLVEPKNPLMLAEKISILLRDENLRSAMGNSGYKRFIKNFTAEKFENGINKAFMTVLER